MTTPDSTDAVPECYKELHSALLEHCRLVVASFRPKLSPADIPGLVQADMAVLERDVRALQALRALAGALTAFLASFEEAAAEPDQRHRTPVLRSVHSGAMRAIKPEVSALSAALLRQLGKTVHLDGPASLDHLKAWKPFKVCMHEAIIVRFTLVPDLPGHRPEGWQDGPDVSIEFLAAVSFLAGTKPCFQSRSPTVKSAMDREISAINMWITRTSRRARCADAQ